MFCQRICSDYEIVSSTHVKFTMDADFCSNCGSILPQATGFSEKIICFCCKNPSDMKAGNKMEYRIVFNLRQDNQEEKVDVDEDEGPVVERVCSKCGCDKMSYATLQLRSADEGQTVFFTCIKCK